MLSQKDGNRVALRAPPGHDNYPRIRIDAPRFNGSDPQGWIFKVHAYYDYYNTAKYDRLSLVGLLIDHSTIINRTIMVQHGMHFYATFDSVLILIITRIMSVS